MKILNETNEKVVKMETEFDIEEFDILIDYFNSHCPKRVQDEIKINWAVINILEQAMEKEDGG